jgi:hypothetical protein
MSASQAGAPIGRMNMKEQEKELGRAEKDLEEGKKVLRAAKKKKKKGTKQARNDLERANAKRSLKTIEKGVRLTEDRRDLLRKQVEEDEAGSEGGR